MVRHRFQILSNCRERRGDDLSPHQIIKAGERHVFRNAAASIFDGDGKADGESVIGGGAGCKMAEIEFASEDAAGFESRLAMSQCRFDAGLAEDVAHSLDALACHQRIFRAGEDEKPVMTELEQMAGDETSTLAMIAGGDIADRGGAVDDGDRHRDIRGHNGRAACRYHDQRVDAAGDHGPDFEILLPRIALTVADQNDETASFRGAFDGLAERHPQLKRFYCYAEDDGVSPTADKSDC